MDVDLRTLLIRLALGPMLFLHGWNKVFGASGLAGATRWFAGLGLRPAWLHARMGAFTELGAGVLVTLGLPVALPLLVVRRHLAGPGSSGPGGGIPRAPA